MLQVGATGIEEEEEEEEDMKLDPSRFLPHHSIATFRNSTQYDPNV
jgi:hypothetical protein